MNNLEKTENKIKPKERIIKQRQFEHIWNTDIKKIYYKKENEKTKTSIREHTKKKKIKKNLLKKKQKEAGQRLDDCK